MKPEDTWKMPRDSGGTERETVAVQTLNDGAGRR